MNDQRFTATSRAVHEVVCCVSTNPIGKYVPVHGTSIAVVESPHVILAWSAGARLRCLTNDR